MRSALLLLFLPALGCGPGLEGSGGRVGDTVPLRAMTFNVGGDGGGGEQTSWDAPQGPRRDDVLALISDEQPDLLAIQEASLAQVIDLADGLPAFEWVGVGRDDGVDAGEFGPLFYRRDRYEHVGDGTFWLSDTPDVPGSSYAESDVRIATWVELIDIDTQRPFVVLNSRWDDGSASGRAFSASLIVQQLNFIAPRPLPRIVLGDFNTDAQSAAMGTLRDGGRLDDAYRVAHPDVMGDEATYHGYGGNPAGSRTDFLLVSTSLVEVASAAIVRTGAAGAWPSDHFPVVADLRW